MTAGDTLHESTHAARVMESIRARIADAGGWLPFDAYMQLALYEPGLGYYSAGAHKMGAAGDFTTAPEISAMFGRCLARHCAGVLEITGGDVLELGAGSGRMAFDVLSTLDAMGSLPDRYLILEVSADLRQRQQQHLAGLPAPVAARVQWLDAPPADAWQGALLANEVLDALPVQCFAWRGGELFERGVAMDDAGSLCWQERPAAAELSSAVDYLRRSALEDWPEGYCSELCRRAEPWIAEVTRTLTRGVALFIDYGLPRSDYYAARRAAGTLRCHYRQRAHADPFAHPGLEDITAWVDFTRVAEAAAAADMEVLGYVTQAALLLALGIEQEVAAAVDEGARVRMAGEARRLLLPQEMGENFKAMALGRNWNEPLAGFALQDLRRML